jgi:hypothetical protein
LLCFALLCFVVVVVVVVARTDTAFGRFSCDRASPLPATRVRVFFRRVIAKITLTLLADSERLPSNFRAGVVDFAGAPS